MRRNLWHKELQSPVFLEGGTSISNPMRRMGEEGYRRCSMCGKIFTRLGLPRHWNHCPEKAKRQK